jgi:hypothetical protein
MDFAVRDIGDSGVGVGGGSDPVAVLLLACGLSLLAVLLGQLFPLFVRLVVVVFATCRYGLRLCRQYLLGEESSEVPVAVRVMADHLVLVNDDALPDGARMPDVGDVRLPGGDPVLAPLVPDVRMPRYRYARHVAMALKAEGLGSLGMDTPDTRRVALLRAVKLMQQHGMRPEHIANQSPMAVAIAFLPTRAEIEAKQLQQAAAYRNRLAEAVVAWEDPEYMPDSRVAPMAF